MASLVIDPSYSSSPSSCADNAGPRGLRFWRRECRRWVVLAVVGISAMLLSACEVAEPEPISSSGPAYPSFAVTSIGSIQPGAVLTGQFVVRLPASVDTSELEHFTIVVDSQLVAQHLTPNTQWPLNLHSFPEGEHLLELYLYEKKGFEGTLGLLVAPNRILLFPFTVDHWDINPPLPATNLQVVWATSPILTWTASPDSHFVAYVVRRHLPSQYPPLVVLDSIFSRFITTYTDTDVSEPIHGTTLIYSVEVTNGHLSTATPEASVSYGKVFPIPNAETILQYPGRTELITITSDQEFVVMSTATNTIVRRGPVARWFHDQRWQISGDGTTLFQLGTMYPDTIRSVCAYNLTTFALTAEWMPSFPLNRSLSAAPGSGTVLVTHSEPGALMLIQGLTGALFDSVSGVFSAENAGRLYVSPDGSTLYALAYGPGGFTTTVKRYSIGGGSFVFQNERPFAEPITSVAFDPAGTVLGVYRSPSGGEAIELLDPVTLATTATIAPTQPFVQGSMSYAFLIKNGAVTFAYLETSDLARVAQVNIATGQVEQKWLFTGLPMQIIRSSDDAFLYALQLNGVGTQPSGWIVSLQ